MSTTQEKPSEPKIHWSEPVLLVMWLVPSTTLYAWSLTVMWRWYAVPIFGAQPLRMVAAFGIATVAMSLAGRMRAHGDQRKTHIILLGSIVNPLMTLAIGWVGSFFV